MRKICFQLEIFRLKNQDGEQRRIQAKPVLPGANCDLTAATGGAAEPILFSYSQTHEFFTSPSQSSRDSCWLASSSHPPKYTTLAPERSPRPWRPRCLLPFHPRGHSSITECSSKPPGKYYRSHFPSRSPAGKHFKSCMTSNQQTQSLPICTFCRTTIVLKSQITPIISPP